MPSKSAGNPAISVSTEAWDRTSSSRVNNLSVASSASSSASRSTRRPVAITRAPAASSRRANASPNPEVAPVTRAMRPLAH